MNKIRKKIVPYGFMFPFLFIYCCFFLYPAVYSLVLSLYKYGGYGSAKFVGFANYKNLFVYKTLWTCLGNTVFYFFFTFVPTMVISFMLAYLVRSKVARRLQRIYKPLIFLPQMCAVVASSLCFKIVFGERVGVINEILNSNIPFLSDMGIMRWTVITMMTWRGIGWYFIIFISGLTGINEEILEAAEIDGASGWNKLRLIVLPMMKPTFLVAFVTNAIGSFKIYTEPNLLLAQNYDPPMKVAPYMNLVVSSMSGGQFGMAAAEGWLLVLIILLLTLLQLKLLGGGND